MSEDELLIELGNHKRRLAAQSARLAAAESEARRLRGLIDGADLGFAVFIDGKFDSADADEQLARMSAEFADADGEKVRCLRVKVVPVNLLEVGDE